MSLGFMPGKVSEQRGHFKRDLPSPPVLTQQLRQLGVKLFLRRQFLQRQVQSVAPVKIRSRKDVDAERINVPATPNFYWRYRLHLPLEKLSAEKKFNTKLSQLLRANGR